MCVFNLNQYLLGKKFAHFVRDAIRIVKRKTNIQNDSNIRILQR